VTDPAPPLTLRDLRAHLGNPFVLAVQGGVALIAGISGPFGTFASLGTGPRMLYWAAVVFGTYAIGAAVSVLVLSRWDRDGAGAALRILRGGALIGAGVSLWLALLALPIRGWHDQMQQTGVTLLAGAFGIAWVIMALREIMPRTTRGAASVPAAPAGSRPPRILSRLPLDRRGPLIALSVQDHYVEIVTARGRDLILMRLSDAIAETEGVDGLQVHRSHWVARDAVRAVRRQGDGAVLTLSDGREVPVARTRLHLLRAAGLLPGPAN